METVKNNFNQKKNNSRVVELAIGKVPPHAKDIEEARKVRADFWVAKIAETVDFDYSKDEIGSERLKFDKLQFLAKADNPDKYGNNSKKVDISIDLKQFKLLKPDEAVKALASGPFAIDAEYTEVKSDDEDLL